MRRSVTPPIQNLDPKKVEEFPSLKIYQQKCQRQALKEGKTFDLNQALVANRNAGDGRFEILGPNPEADFYCSAQINWRNHEMLIDTGTLTTKKGSPLGAL